MCTTGMFCKLDDLKMALFATQQARDHEIYIDNISFGAETAAIEVSGGWTRPA